MKVYISGPISLGGKLSPEQTAENKRKFTDAAVLLRSHGYEVVDPTRNKVDYPEGITLRGKWVLDMKVAIIGMMECDAIYLLEGWEQSEGAVIEKELASDLGYMRMYDSVAIG